MVIKLRIKILAQIVLMAHQLKNETKAGGGGGAKKPEGRGVQRSQ